MQKQTGRQTGSWSVDPTFSRKADDAVRHGLSKKEHYSSSQKSIKKSMFHLLFYDSHNRFLPSVYGIEARACNDSGNVGGSDDGCLAMVQMLDCFLG